MLPLISCKPTHASNLPQSPVLLSTFHTCLTVFSLVLIIFANRLNNVYQVYITYYAAMCDITFEAVASTCHILYQAQCQTSMSSKFPKNQNDGRRFWLVTDLCLCMKQNKQEHKNEQINLKFLSPTTSVVIGPLLLLC